MQSYNLLAVVEIIIISLLSYAKNGNSKFSNGFSEHIEYPSNSSVFQQHQSLTISTITLFSTVSRSLVNTEWAVVVVYLNI